MTSECACTGPRAALEPNCRDFFVAGAEGASVWRFSPRDRAPHPLGVRQKTLLRMSASISLLWISTCGHTHTHRPLTRGYGGYTRIHADAHRHTDRRCYDDMCKILRSTFSVLRSPLYVSACPCLEPGVVVEELVHPLAHSVVEVADIHDVQS